MRRPIDTLIVDLDNTIFDWLAFWYESFNPIYNRILDVSGQPREVVDQSIQEVHRLRRTSEYPFLIHEVDVLAQARIDGNINEIFKEALRESAEGRDRSLALYPTVLRTLWNAKESGTRIVAYTESLSFYSSYRLKRFGLDGLVDILFSPADHEMPPGISVDEHRRLAPEFYQLQITRVLHTPPGELKPNPRVLSDIIQSVGADPSMCAYVGDSLFKDVAMARDVSGVLDIFAKYGSSHHKPEYDLLQRVSHWTDEDIDRERTILSRASAITPTITLWERFSEIEEHCEFVSAKAEAADKLDKRYARAMEAWKQCVEVQRHFNDLSMRVRNYAVTVVGVFVAAIGVLFQSGSRIAVYGIIVPTASALSVAALFAWGAFYLMDRFWYHILLKGAVNHAIKIENAYKNLIPEISMGTTITEASTIIFHIPHKRLALFKPAFNSTRRVNWFYMLGGIGILILGGAIFLADRQEAQRPAQRIEITKPIELIVPEPDN